MHDQSCRNDRSWFGKFLEIKNKNDLGCWCKLDLWHNNFKDIYKKMEIIVVCAKCESLFLSKNKKKYFTTILELKTSFSKGSVLSGDAYI